MKSSSILLSVTRNRHIERDEKRNTVGYNNYTEYEFMNKCRNIAFSWLGQQEGSFSSRYVICNAYSKNCRLYKCLKIYVEYCMESTEIKLSLIAIINQY